MSNKWVIKDTKGNVTNQCIKGSEEFVSANFDYYEAFVEPSRLVLSAAESARMWRDEELLSSDSAAKIPDWPNRDNIIAYRQKLREWPSKKAFPKTKPTL